MKNIIILLLALLFVSHAAVAKTAHKKQEVEQNSMFRSKDEIGKGTMFRTAEDARPEKKEKKEKSETPLVSKKECDALVAYQPKVDGNVEYKPGVDAHGKPVMEADITPSVIQPPEKISFDLNIDLAKYIGMTVPAGTMGEAKMGTITIEKGQVQFNGKPLEGDAEAALRALCSPHKEVKKKAKKSAK